MARPSKLSDRQWEEIQKRSLAGEQAADLAREFKVSPATICRRVTKPAQNVKAVANQLVSADAALRSLPVTQQLMALDLAENLRQMAGHIGSAAVYSAASAHRVAAALQGVVQRIDDTNPAASMDEMKLAAGMSKLVNDLAVIPTAILNANKGSAAIEPPKAATMTLADFYADARPHAA